VKPAIEVTGEAHAHLIDELSGRVLRIAFTTGCGGSGYRLHSADAPEADDVTVDVSGVRIALDSMAASNLEGAVIRWSDDEDGYLLDHPTAVTAVWCG
jgi:Fe-S cluster assembly iron-binding protein IscA